MDAERLIDDMRLFAISADAVHRAAPRAQRAADAFFRVDFIAQQRFADFRRAFFVVNMRFVLVAEMLERAQHRIRRGFAQHAEARRVDLRRQAFQLLNVAIFPFAIADSFENIQHLARSDAAGDALAARLFLAEIEEKPRHIDHARIFVHDNHAA